MTRCRLLILHSRQGQQRHARRPRISQAPVRASAMPLRAEQRAQQ